MPSFSSRRKRKRSASKFRRFTKRRFSRPKGRKRGVYASRARVVARSTINTLSRKQPTIKPTQVDKLFKSVAPVWKNWKNSSNDGSIRPYQLSRQNYGQTTTIGDGALTVPFTTLRLNSVYDPDYTGVGSQPNGYDLMATVYKKYAVIGCRYTVTFRNNSNAFTLACGAYPSTASSHVGVYDNYLESIERPTISTALVDPAANNTHRSTATVTGYVKMKNWGVNSGTGGYKTFQELFGSEIASNPSQGIYLHCTAVNQDNTAPASSSVKMDIQLSFDVIYYDPQDTEDS